MSIDDDMTGNVPCAKWSSCQGQEDRSCTLERHVPDPKCKSEISANREHNYKKVGGWYSFLKIFKELLISLISLKDR